MSEDPNPQFFRLTHTKVQCFLRCQRQYWFAYECGEPWPEEEEGPAIVVGNAVHRAMQELVECNDPGVTRQRVDAYLRMPKHEAAGPGTAHYETAMECTERGIEVHQSIPAKQSWAERSIWARWPSRAIEMLARVDRVDELEDGRFQVIDWKTGRFDDPAVVDDQLDLAHVAVRVGLATRIGRDAEVTTIAWNLRTGTKRERPLRREDAAAAMGRAAGVARRIQQETEFGAMPGPHCGYCRWRPQCPEGQSVVDGTATTAVFNDVDALLEGEE